MEFTKEIALSLIRHFFQGAFVWMLAQGVDQAAIDQIAVAVAGIVAALLWGVGNKLKVQETTKVALDAPAGTTPEVLVERKASAWRLTVAGLKRWLGAGED